MWAEVVENIAPSYPSAVGKAQQQSTHGWTGISLIGVLYLLLMGFLFSHLCIHPQRFLLPVFGTVSSNDQFAEPENFSQ